MISEPKNLMDVLARLEDARREPAVTKRQFRRYSIRGDGQLEPMDDRVSHEPVRILLRDISRGGIGFLVDNFIEPATMWRARFLSHGQVAATQPLIIRYCRSIDDNLFVAGGQFVIEPFALSILGVSVDELRNEDMQRCSELDIADFNAPDEI